MTGEVPPRWLSADARQVYGHDPQAYEAGRPDYPARVYVVLRRLLSPRSLVLEIGPGTGRITRRLVSLGAHVVAVEPDPALVAYLRDTLPGSDVEVRAACFEEVELPDARFDLAVAAMSFHWVDQAIGLPKLGRVVRPGGRVAIWWTVFRDPEWPDAFEEASRERLAAHGIHPHQQPQFELDVVRRVDDLTQHAGLGEVEAELIRWTVTMTASEVRALYGSMINVLRRPEPDRLKLLDGLEQIASEEFGGVVERSFVTALYSARRP